MPNGPRDPESYSRRMDRAAKCIEEALGRNEKPTLEQLASAAALSPFHFHRVYRLLAGETVGQTLQRLKLAYALDLVSNGETITGAAHASGYESSQSLAKAVAQRTGSSITDLRSAGDLDGNIQKLRSGKGDRALQFELVDHDPVTIACRLVTGPYPQLNLAYRSLFEDVCAAASPEQVDGVFGIPVDDPRDVPESEHRFVAALAVTGMHERPDGTIELRKLGGGRFARAGFVGPYAEVPEAIDRLYQILIGAGPVLRDAETFLHYVDQPATDDGPDTVHETLIYIPVEE